jgi:hypothetical protein
MMIAGQSYTVTQANGCTYILAPTSNVNVLITGGTNFTVTVTTDAACGWSASVDAAFTSWIHITSGANYTGTQTLHYNVDLNALGPHPRTGTMTIAGHSFQVTQQ